LEGISLYHWLVQHHLWSPKLRTKLLEVKEQTMFLSPEVWLLSMIPCPLLTDKNQCSAYEARPFMCRTIFSKGDPHYCHPHRLGANLAGILDRTESVAALWKAEGKTLKRHQLRQVAIPLAAALLLAERVSKGDIELEETNTTLLEEVQHEG
jgi:Fe-S-cluster containining protein